MTEPAQPLSRRERRALEEAARAAEGEVTQALPVAGEPETVSIMSRRERRRLERLANPLETWTEEEELIATGQMPAMTPEVLAEQDRIAAERAEAERAEAERAASAYAEAAPADEVAYEPEPEPVADAVAAPEPAAEPEPEPVADVVEEPAPAPAPEPAAEPESASEPAVQQPEAQQIPADLRHLFPPGSLQARAFEAREASAPVATDPAAADEIRQLTHEAMAGITRASTGATPVVDEVQSDVPELPEGIDVEALWNAPTVDEPIREAVLPPANAVDGASDAPVDLADVPFVQELPVPAEPHAGEAPGTAPVWSALVPTTPSEFVEGRAAAPAPAVEDKPASSLWDTHPLINPSSSPVRELPPEPASHDLPRPDLSALLNTQANPTVEQQAQLRSTEPLTTTGAMPQRVVEPQAGGGTRHFRWAHLAVIGAIAFVLGVLAWNIARSGS
jgi:hypothetical protein